MLRLISQSRILSKPPAIFSAKLSKPPAIFSAKLSKPPAIFSAKLSKPPAIFSAKLTRSTVAISQSPPLTANLPPLRSNANVSHFSTTAAFPTRNHSSIASKLQPLRSSPSLSREFTQQLTDTVARRFSTQPDSFYKQHSLRGKNRRPPDYIDPNEIIRLPIRQQEISAVTPKDTAIEVRFATCHNPNAKCLSPKFRMHALMASYVEHGKLIHLVDTKSKAKPDWIKLKQKIEKEIKKQLACDKEITKEELQELWFDDGPSFMNFWIERFVKHYRFSHKDYIPNYATLTGSLAKKILIDDVLESGEERGSVLVNGGGLGNVLFPGGKPKNVFETRVQGELERCVHGLRNVLVSGGELDNVLVPGEDPEYVLETGVQGKLESCVQRKGDLGSFLASKRFVVGKYHDTYDLQSAVEEYFEVKGFPTFDTQGMHPYLKEVCVLRTDDGAESRDHPMSYLVPRGAHSTGIIYCKFFNSRLIRGTGVPDSTLDSDFLDILRSKCNNNQSSSSSPLSSPSPSTSTTESLSLSPSPSSVSTINVSAVSSIPDTAMKMDYEGPGRGFGTLYYRSLLQGKGLLFVDQQLTSGEETEAWVRAYASDVNLFQRDFALVMMKLSDYSVLSAPMGQVRLDCRKVV